MPYFEYGATETSRARRYKLSSEARCKKCHNKESKALEINGGRCIMCRATRATQFYTKLYDEELLDDGGNSAQSAARVIGIQIARNVTLTKTSPD